MKKLIAVAMVIVMILGLFSGCDDPTPKVSPVPQDVEMICDKAGEYTVEKDKGIDSVLIKTDGGGVTLKDSSVKDIVIDKAVGDGEVTLSNVKADNLYVRGGGENSLHIQDSCEIKNVHLARAEGTIRIVVDFNSTVSNLQVDKESKDVILTGNFKDVEILSEDINVLAVSASIGSLEVSVQNVRIEGDDKTEIIDTKIKGENVEFKNKGKTETINVSADGAKIEAKGVDVVVDSDVNGTIVGGKNVKEGTKLSVTEGGSVLLPLPSVPDIPKVTNSVWDGTSVDYSWYDANKTVFEINSASQFAGFRNIVNGDVTLDGGKTITCEDFAGKTVKLKINIDLNKKEWTPIGNVNNRTNMYTTIGGISGEKRFSGAFDGGNHTISNLKIGEQDARADKNFQGLFGYIHGATISNLTLKDFNIYLVNSINGDSAGALSALAHTSKIENVNVKGGNISGNEGIGGIVGRTAVLTVKNSKNSANVSSATSQAGGIVAMAYIPTWLKLDKETDQSKMFAYKFENVENSGTIKGILFAGGIVGLGNYASFKDCTNNGIVTSYDDDGALIKNILASGGIIGGANEANFDNCKNLGAVTSRNYSAGGIAGTFTYYLESNARDAVSFLTNSSNEGVIDGKDYSGGIIGNAVFDYKKKLVKTLVVADCENSGIIISKNGQAGGIVGNSTALKSINECDNSGAVQGGLAVGGISGRNDATITNCTNKGNIILNVNYVEKVSNYYSGVGGIVGVQEIQDSSVKISDCTNNGAVSASGTGAVCGVGGIIGLNSFNAVISNNTQASATNAQMDITGYNSEISNCKNTGTIKNDVIKTTAIGISTSAKGNIAGILYISNANLNFKEQWLSNTSVIGENQSLSDIGNWIYSANWTEFNNFKNERKLLEGSNTVIENGIDAVIDTTNNMNVNGTLTVKNGATLTINGTISANQNGAIVLENGANVVVGVGAKANGIVAGEVGELTVYHWSGNAFEEAVLFESGTLPTSGAVYVNENATLSEKIDQSAKYIIASGKTLTVKADVSVEKANFTGLGSVEVSDASAFEHMLSNCGIKNIKTGKELTIDSDIKIITDKIISGRQFNIASDVTVTVANSCKNLYLSVKLINNGNLILNGKTTLTNGLSNANGATIIVNDVIMSIYNSFENNGTITTNGMGFVDNKVKNI